MEKLLDGIREVLAGLGEILLPKPPRVAVIPRTPPVAARRSADREAAGIYRPVKR